MAIDWEKIRTEYVTTATSYRKLGEKYGVNFSLIGEKAREEKWPEQRTQHRNITYTKTLDKISSKQASRASALHDAVDKLLDRIAVGINKAEMISPSAAKYYSEALRNIKDILMIRSELDIEEQQIRIAKLRKDAERDDRNTNITVTLAGELESYSR